MRDFFKYTLASFVGAVLFTGTAIVGLATLIGFLVATGDTKPTLSDRSILVLNLATQITDAPRSSDGLPATLSGNTVRTISAQLLKQALERAAQDPKIVGIYLQGSSQSSGAGYATLKEVRESLAHVRAAGKKIIAYDTEWSKPEYYLASVADTIALHPFGSLELNGLRTETPFFAGALEKLGIGVQVTRVGKYKSAVEPFLSNQRSKADLEQSVQLLTELWSEFLNGVATARNLNPKLLQDISDRKGILNSQVALDEKLITEIAYQDQVLDELKRLTGQTGKTAPLRQVSLQTYAKSVKESLLAEQASKPKIAVLYADGEIVDGRGGQDSIGSDRFAEEIRKLRTDSSIRAVVLRVNSPGGSVTASDVIQREIILTQKVKPVVVSMGNYAASGGYWIATYSDRIFAQPNTITGSIGVFGLLLNIQKLSNNNGIKWDVIKTGTFADLDTISRPKTAQEMALFQTEVDRVYDQFLTKVATSRKLPKTKVAEIAQGRVWSGRAALKLGLVDELGGLDDAIQAAAKRAKLQKGWRVVEYPKPRSWKEEFFKELTDDSDEATPSNNALIQEFGKFQHELTALAHLHDPLNIYARLPFRFNLD